VTQFKSVLATSLISPSIALTFRKLLQEVQYYTLTVTSFYSHKI